MSATFCILRTSTNRGFSLADLPQLYLVFDQPIRDKKQNSPIWVAIFANNVPIEKLKTNWTFKGGLEIDSLLFNFEHFYFPSVGIDKLMYVLISIELL